MSLSVWKGVLIEESLEDTSILPTLHIVNTRSTTLENEENRGKFHFHSIEVSDGDVMHIVEEVSSAIKDRWYFHVVQGTKMIVVFRNKVFTADKGDKNEIDTIREYGISQGILKEQLGLERLFDHPFD